MVDYAVHYVRKADKVSTKIFKWKTIELAAGEEIELTKKRNIKQTSLRGTLSRHASGRAKDK